MAAALSHVNGQNINQLRVLGTHPVGKLICMDGVSGQPQLGNSTAYQALGIVQEANKGILAQPNSLTPAFIPEWARFLALPSMPLVNANLGINPALLAGPVQAGDLLPIAIVPVPAITAAMQIVGVVIDSPGANGLANALFTGQSFFAYPPAGVQPITLTQTFVLAPLHALLEPTPAPTLTAPFSTLVITDIVFTNETAGPASITILEPISTFTMTIELAAGATIQYSLVFLPGAISFASDVDVIATVQYASIYGTNATTVALELESEVTPQNFITSVAGTNAMQIASTDFYCGMIFQNNDETEGTVPHTVEVRQSGAALGDTGYFSISGTIGTNDLFTLPNPVPAMPFVGGNNTDSTTWEMKLGEAVEGGAGVTAFITRVQRPTGGL